MIPALASLVVGSATGYYIGKTQRTFSLQPLTMKEPPGAPGKGEPPAPRPEPQPKPKREPRPTPEPAKPGAPPAEPPAVPATATPSVKILLSADAALQAFLQAPDWKTRTELVIFPDDMRPSIERRAAELGDGPFIVTSITLLRTEGSSHMYQICTPEIPEGFPVSVMETKDGAKVNWENFLNFHDDLFRKFAAGPAEATGIFHVLVRPDPPSGGEAEASFSRFKLSVPMPGREQPAWIRKDSVALAKIRAILDGSGGISKADVDKAIGEAGFPFTLKLVKRQPNERQQFIEIVDFITIGWLPGTE